MCYSLRSSLTYRTALYTWNKIQLQQRQAATNCCLPASERTIRKDTKPEPPTASRVPGIYQVVRKWLGRLEAERAAQQVQHLHSLSIGAVSCKNGNSSSVSCRPFYTSHASLCSCSCLVGTNPIRYDMHSNLASSCSVQVWGWG